MPTPTFFLDFAVHGDHITFEWNGDIVDFSRWPADAYGHFEYTTRNLRSYFVFDIQPVDATTEVRIYIDQQPDYDGRDGPGVDLHRNTDDAGRHYVCVKADLQPTNVPHALSWAVYFAEKTDHFIATGDAFS